MICVLCGGPTPCDCWKLRLTPAERHEAQAAVVAKWELERDRREFEGRRHTERLLDRRRGARGGFGLVKRGPRMKETDMKRIASVILVALCLFAAPVWAQTPVPSPTPTTTLIAFDHDGVNTDGYRIRVDTAAATAITPTCAVVASVRTCEFPFPAMTPGNHSFVIIAWNAAGESASEPFAVTLFVAPASPGNIRIVIR